MQLERTKQPGRTLPDLRVRSGAFGDGEPIPRRFTQDGENVSPPLTWSDPPEGTSSFALVCEDPDAPSGLFVHWLVWNIDPDVRGLIEAVPTDDARLAQGENGFGEQGYGGPSPPPGKPHRYVFRLYALDYRPELPRGSRRGDFDRALESHVLAQGTLVGKYGR
jgi:Raf kinase inhibitor-like YbhB/YbcL family protein